MIFLLAKDSPVMFVMLTEADCNDMRGGRTKFVDTSATKGAKFEHVVISLHKDRSEIDSVLRKSGHGGLKEDRDMPSPVPGVLETKCKGCDAILRETLLLDGKCISCWRELAKVQERRNKEN